MEALISTETKDGSNTDTGSLILGGQLVVGDSFVDLDHIERTFEAISLDEIHLTMEQFEDVITYEPDGTAVLFDGQIRHRCPEGTPCADAATEALTLTPDQGEQQP